VISHEQSSANAAGRRRTGLPLPPKIFDRSYGRKGPSNVRLRPPSRGAVLFSWLGHIYTLTLL
jgi:hypothetical protein